MRTKHLLKQGGAGWTRRDLLASGLLLATLPLTATATATATEPSVRLVTGNGYAPYTDEALPEGGLVNDLVKRVYELIGVDYTIDWKPWKRGFQEGITGEYVATYPYIYNEERNRYFAYSEPVYESNLRLFSLIEANLSPTGLDDARGRRMCFPLGWAPGPKLAELFAATAVLRDEPQDMETCFRLLDRARTDFVLANEIQGWNSANAVGLDDTRVAMSDFNVEVNPVHVIFSREVPNYQAELERFNTGLAALRASGEYDKIVRKHLTRLAEGEAATVPPPESQDVQ